MELIDTHCHLDIGEFAPCFNEVLLAARVAGVGEIVLPGVIQEGWDRLMSLCSEDEGLHAAPGLHPLYLANHRPHHLEELAELAMQGGLIAIGEIGLDYYPEAVDRRAQQQLFERQMDIARSEHLPLLLHVRKAHDQVLATLRRKKFPHGGIIHAFNGSYQQACHYIKLGFGIGICGTITYERARKIRRVAMELPETSLVLETDAPDIPLADHRGESNLPKYLPGILASLAALRGEHILVTAKYTNANAKRILGLP
jgi:TatD DNase family protein